MKNLVIAGIVLFAVLIGAIYAYVGDIIGDDMVNILSMLAAIVILAISIVVSLKYVNQMKNDKASGTLAEENWDGIGEYKNPIPVGWGLSFIGTIVFGIWYWVAGYPTWAFSQIGQWNEETIAYNTKFESKWVNADAKTLKAMGESLFLVQCAPCHGTTADGLNGKAANLTKRLEYATVKNVIEKGSKGVGNEAGQLGFALGIMPDRTGLVSATSGSPISDAEIDAVAHFVAKGLPTADANGKELFTAYCSACHGEDGKGMGGSTPNLAEFDQPIIDAVLNNGKKGAIGTMPAFKGRLTEVQYKAVQHYLSSLSK